MENQFVSSCKIYMEAEDITQSRIQTTVSFVENLFKNCRNTYFHHMKLDNESDMEDFAIRLYVDDQQEELECSSKEDAESFLCDMMELLDKVAQAHSYLDMEGRFSLQYHGIKKTICFTSETNQGFCDFFEE